MNYSFLIATCLLLTTPANAEPGVVELIVEGLESSEGQVLVALFDEAKGYPTKPEKAVLKAAVPARAPQVTVFFEDVPEGRYAAFAIHDIDGDGELDVGRFIPIPKEPVGASRDARGVMGPPKFADAAFEVTSDGAIERITVAPL